MTGHFLYYICLMQHKRINPKDIEFFVIEILKDLAFLGCKNYIGYVILVKFRLSFHTFLGTLMKVMD